jgi:hypothetical protein
MGKLSVAEIYENSAALRDKVTYGAGGVDEDILARAEAAVAGLQEDYLVWAEQDIGAIERQCASVLALPEDERAHTIGELFATVHGMKGQGGTFGFPMITRVADSLSRFIEHRTFCGPREMDVINVHINAMRVVIVERLTDDGGIKGQQMLLGLEHVLEKFARQ